MGGFEAAPKCRRRGVRSGGVTGSHHVLDAEHVLVGQEPGELACVLLGELIVIGQGRKPCSGHQGQQIRHRLDASAPIRQQDQ